MVPFPEAEDLGSLQLLLSGPGNVLRLPYGQWNANHDLLTCNIFYHEKCCLFAWELKYGRFSRSMIAKKEKRVY